MGSCGPTDENKMYVGRQNFVQTPKFQCVVSPLLSLAALVALSVPLQAPSKHDDEDNQT